MHRPYRWPSFPSRPLRLGQSLVSFASFYTLCNFIVFPIAFVFRSSCARPVIFGTLFYPSLIVRSFRPCLSVYTLSIARESQFSATTVVGSSTHPSKYSSPQGPIRQFVRHTLSSYSTGAAGSLMPSQRPHSISECPIHVSRTSQQENKA